MTNSKHLVKCPYYEYEKENFIKCEDVKRSFKWIKQKDDYMYKFCDEDWQKCEYARRMDQAYEEGIDMEKVKAESLRSEYRKIERRLKQCEARNIAKDEEIKKLRKRCKYFESYRDRYIKAEADAMKTAKEIMALTAMYEARFAYLMAEFADGVLCEKDMDEWSKDREFAIIADEVEDGKVSKWRVLTRFKDDQDDDTTESEDEKEQSEDSDEPEDRTTDDSSEQ